MRLLRSLLPSSARERVKARLLDVLHAKPEITSRIANRVLREGVPRYLGWNFEEEKAATLAYLERLRVGEYEYRFADSVSEPTLYGSVYACMLLGMYGELERASPAFRYGWLDYLDSFQDPKDGYFRDPRLAGPAFDGTPEWGDGWGIRHLAAHAIIAYARLGRPPLHPFRFLDRYYDPIGLQRWLGKFDFSTNVWSQSNYIMNAYSLLQYARDYMGERGAAPAVEAIAQWLLQRQRRDTGMWHDYELRGYPEIGDAVRGAYHFYPLFVYEGRPIPHAEAIVDVLLRSQNSWGGFNPEEMPSGACEDIDAIEPLIRASRQTVAKRAEVDAALRRALVWVLACRHPSGGYESMPDNGCHYGNHPLTTSRPAEANLFATWFRTLCLSYVVEALGLCGEIGLGTFPGYELALTGTLRVVRGSPNE